MSSPPSSRWVQALGTASQVPTRSRAHQSMFVNLDDFGVLFDPGEGTQRQLTHAGLPASRIDAICITHLHGDHCLGLPGVVQRLALDQVEHEVQLLYPVEGQEYIDRLLGASIFESEHLRLCLHAVDSDGVSLRSGAWSIHSRALDHRVPCRGWRIEEDDGWRVDPDSARAVGVEGPDIGRIVRDGAARIDGRTVAIDEIASHRPGQAVAFVMDTRRCSGANELAAGADLAVIESTFLGSSDEDQLADIAGHLTAAQAAELASAAGVRRLVLTHFSQRHPDVEPYRAEAAAHHPDVHAVRDLDIVEVPSRA